METSRQTIVSRSDFEDSTIVNAPADQVFAFVSDVRNTPRYLPTVKRAESAGNERIRTQGQVGEKTYDADGHFRINQQTRRLEWGSDGENDYWGWLQVDGDGNQAQVRVFIHYHPQIEKARMMAEKHGNSFEAAMQEGIAKTLASIKNICEGHGGKEEVRPNQQYQHES